METLPDTTLLAAKHAAERAKEATAVQERETVAMAELALRAVLDHASLDEIAEALGFEDGGERGQCKHELLIQWLPQAAAVVAQDRWRGHTHESS